MIHKAEHILSIFQEHPKRCAPITGHALKIKEHLERISPFIDRYTAITCFECSSKCCINRHAYCTADDLIYLYALGIYPETQELQRSIHEEQCQFLMSSGCALERHQRPLGCTWHFCDNLTLSIQQDSHDSYGDFSDAFDTLFLTWIEMTSKFRSLHREVSGRELDTTLMRSASQGLTFPWVRI